MLSKRLNAILNLIEINDIVADVGTDHGYLLKACLDKGITKVQAIDNKEGPLNCAKTTLSSYGKRVVMSLSDGISVLDDDVNTVVIAGMGGETIISILEKKLEKAKKIPKLILEPNIKVYELRKFLNENSFEITLEQIVLDANKYYEIIVASFSKTSQCLTEIELKYGPCLLKNKTCVFLQKYEQRLLKLKSIAQNNKNLAHINVEILEIENILRRIYD